ncbi:DnaJ-domain-containing protein [Pleomassaria siparia CBS 279.74]|uniref:DnaJ-domain-containing protein n=1 Tax=Pleomassaria siparia CBS 279.74 TaxID=1314801 RepID=A0A6G1KM35_9PLEO|nr:DnaJ-domain-containing protein [Pleomassaria siparia CBS 279.74]
MDNQHQLSALQNDDNSILDDACAVPLPGSPTLSPMNGLPYGQGSTGVDNASASHFTEDTRVDTDYQQPTPPKPAATNKRVRRQNPSREFSVFVEQPSQRSAPNPAPKKKTKTGRKVLGEISGNKTPPRKYRDPTMGFGFNPNDPNYEDLENVDQSPPPPPPPPISPPQPPRQQARPQRHRANRPRPTHVNTTPTDPAVPKCLVLYNLLEVKNWKASEEEIKVAYRHVALLFHPDKATQEDQELATVYMQHINAAKEVLLDGVRRAEYHRTGKLPWTV